MVLTVPYLMWLYSLYLHDIFTCLFNNICICIPLLTAFVMVYIYIRICVCVWRKFSLSANYVIPKDLFHYVNVKCFYVFTQYFIKLITKSKSNEDMFRMTLRIRQYFMCSVSFLHTYIYIYIYAYYYVFIWCWTSITCAIWQT